MNRGLKGGHAAARSSNSHSSTTMGDWFFVGGSCTEDTADSCSTTTTSTHFTSSNNNNAVSSPKGLVNVGNTCYANATLQCLLNTALIHALTDPTAISIFRGYSSNPNLLLSRSASIESDCASSSAISSSVGSCSTGARNQRRAFKTKHSQIMQENCQWLTQELKLLTLKYHNNNSSGSVQNNNCYSNQYDYYKIYSSYFTANNNPSTNALVDPGSITRHPHRLCSSLRPYAQEDAHEFLRALLGTLTLHGQNKQLSSLFDGLLESSVTCQSCLQRSISRDRYMDLSLDITSAFNLQEALAEFCETEVLADSNAVYCSLCRSKQAATKALRLATAPSILVCHLKRFAMNEFGNLRRLQKHITFPTKLEIGSYMSKVNQAKPPPYDLKAVLVHQGTSCEYGHYLAFVKNHNNNTWYKCNDNNVQQVDISVVLNQQAYILFYEVAEMREGFSIKQPSQTRSTRSSTDDHPFYSSFLCGYDSTFLSDICSSWGRSGSGRRRRRRRRKRDMQSSRDDLSTLGESAGTVTETSRFRRSASSGNLKEQDQTPKPRAVRSNSVSRVVTSTNSGGSGNSTSRRRVSRRSTRSGSALPPRHRRVASSNGKV